VSTPERKRAEKGDGQSLSPAACAQKMSDLLPEDPLSAQINKLREEQQALANNKRLLAKELRNAQRKKQRVRSRARQLTDADLVAVMMMRKEQRAKQQNGKEAPEVAGVGSDAASSGGASSSGSAGSAASGGEAARDEPEEQAVADTDL